MDPLADGGEDVDENLALACKRCNIAKGTQPYKYFRAIARVAFWNEAPEPAADKDLDDLLVSWAGTHQGVWSYKTPSAGGNIEVWCRPFEEISDTADELVATLGPSHGRGNKQGSVAEFVVRAHRALPGLIAEIRTLRAELAEVRAAQADGANTSAA